MPRPPRLGDSEYLGYRSFFLTICCYRKRALFNGSEVVESVLQHFLHACDARQFALTAYCFMPDHLHALVAGLRDDSDLTQFVSLAKQRSGFYYKRVYQAQLWQEGYFDRVLRTDEPEMAVIRYIVSNPIRSQIVKTAQEYPFWGSQVHTRDELLDAISRL